MTTHLLKLQFGSYLPQFNIIINEDSVINGHNKLLNTNLTLLSSTFDTSIVLKVDFMKLRIISDIHCDINSGQNTNFDFALEVFLNTID